MLRQFLIIIIISIFYSTEVFSNTTHYKLQLNFPQQAGQQIKLGNYYGNSLLLNDVLTLDKNGYLKSYDLPHPGVFVLLLPDSSSFEFMVVDTGLYSITIDNNNFTLEANPAAEDYIRFSRKLFQTSQRIDSLAELARMNAQNPIYRQKQRSIKNSIDSLTNIMAIKHKGNLMGDYCKALQMVEIPEKLRSGDSASWIKSINYYREHFFDHINWNNENLVYTPLLDEKINFYINQVISQNTQDLQDGIKYLFERSNSSEVRRFIAVTLLNNFQNNRHNPVSESALVFLSENYILNSTIPGFSDEYLERLEKLVGQIKPGMLGVNAPEIELFGENGSTISWLELAGHTTVILFWDYSCPICSRVINQFNAVMDNYPEVRVVTVFPGNDRDIWIAWIKKRLRSRYINTMAASGEAALQKYNVSSLPAIYVLDNNQLIINKNITIQELEEFLNGLSN